MTQLKGWILVCTLILILAISSSCRVSQNQAHQAAQTPGIESRINSNELLNITLIQHESCPWSYFWCVIETGINDAAQNLNVNVTIKRPNEFDPEAVQAILVEELESIKAKSNSNTAEATQPDAIGIAVVDADLFRAPLTELIQSYDIPVIAYNAGAGAIADQIPYRTYIGQNDERAGYNAGQRLAKEANSNSTAQAVCIMHEDAPNLKARCNGFQQAMDAAGQNSNTLVTSPNSTLSEDILIQYLTQHPESNIFLTVGPKGAAPFYQAIKQVNRPKESYVHGSFDLSSITLNEIQTGGTLFTIDQQPYLEGYLTVQWLAWISRHQFSPPDDIISTGPYFVDQDSVDKVIEEVGQYR